MQTKFPRAKNLIDVTSRPSLGLSLALWTLAALAANAQTGGTAVSALAGQYTPGTALTVTITVTPVASTSAYAVEDQPPAGWVVSNINQSGVYDSANNKVKWGLFTDNQARTLSYQVTPPTTASGTVTFQGSANFDGLITVPIGGQRQSTAAPAGYAPTIISQPMSLTNRVGDLVTFSASATGTAPLVYQWQFNGASVAGATNSALSLTNVQSINAGNYLAVVSNGFGSATSQVAVLTVLPPNNQSTVVSSLPAQYVPGTVLTVTITVTPAATVSAYAVEDQPPNGWTVSNITRSGVYDSANNKVKWGLFTDNQPRTLSYQVTPPPTASGTVSFQGSANFDGLVTVPIGGQRQSTAAPAGNAPSIISQPLSSTNHVGDLLTFSVSATGTAPLVYQWQFNGVGLAGATNSALSLTNVQSISAGNYLAVVSNGFGSATSQVAVLTVLLPNNQSTVVSSLPAQYVPGTALTVSITVSPASSVSAYAVEDQPPTGWTVSNVSQGGVFDSVNNKVKWGLFTDNQARTLSYQVTPPTAASGRVTFQGSANFDGLTTVPIGGQRQSAANTGGSGNASTAISTLFPEYSSGVALTVTIVVSPASSVSAYAVEDQPPAGWTVSNVDNGGVYDSVNQKVKWGLFTDNTPRTLTYLATPPPNAAGTVSFQGSANFDGLTTVPITGQRQTTSGTIAGPTLSLSMYAGITLTGTAGLNYRIEVGNAVGGSTNWTTLATFTLMNSPSLFFDTNSPSHLQRFYRAVLVP